MKPKSYTIILVSIAALGGILYGYDLGIIGIALLYLDKCVSMSESQVGLLAAAVMIGALASSVIGGGLSDMIGRKKTLMVAAVLFTISVFMIILSHGYLPLFLGRVLQGLSAGMIGVVVPIFMTECAPAKIRGLSATTFQLCICVGYSISMASGAWYQAVAETAITGVAGEAARILAIQDHAWRMMFLTSVYPAVVFFVLALLVAESPRWLFRHGRKDKALANLLKTRNQEQAALEIAEMEELAASASVLKGSGGDSLFKRHYWMPLLLAVTLLAINQATGINSVLPFMALMLKQAGLSELLAGKSALILTTYLMFPTIFGVLLVDKLGRRRLLQIGTSLIMIALTAGVLIFWSVEAGRTDVSDKLRAAVAGSSLLVPVTELGDSTKGPVQVSVQYAFGKGADQSCLVRSDAKESILKLVPGEKDAGAELRILRAKFSAAPAEKVGWMVCVCILLYLTGFCFGPGVVLWLMSAELLPTRVRSLGMGVGVLGNALVSIAFTWMFLPVVGNYGYAAMWGVWGICTLAYFLFATFGLPETRGKTLEEIEAHFAGTKLRGE